MLPIFVIIPLGVAFIIPLISKRREGLAQVLANLCAVSLLCFSVFSIFWLKGGIKIYHVGGWRAPFGICLVLDGLTVLMLLVVNLIGCMALIYSLNYIRRFLGGPYYYTLFCLLLAGLNGVVISGDLFNLFVFLEITSIASYALVAFGVEAEELEAAFNEVSVQPTEAATKPAPAEPVAESRPAAESRPPKAPIIPNILPNQNPAASDSRS